MNRSDKKYYTRTKFGAVFFISVGLLLLLAIYIFAESSHIDMSYVSHDYGKIAVGTAYDGADELGRAREELSQNSTVTADENFKEKYPSLYAMFTLDESVKDGSYTESNGEYIGMAKTFYRRFSRYINVEVAMMDYTCSPADGTVTVKIAEPRRYNLQYEKKTGRVRYSITTGTDARLKIDSLQIELDGAEFSRAAYNLNTIRDLSDKEAAENKFQQFVSIYTGNGRYVLSQHSPEDKKSVAAYADFGFRDSIVGIKFNLSGDLYDVYYGAEITADYIGAGELRYSLKIN